MARTVPLSARMLEMLAGTALLFTAALVALARTVFFAKA